MIQLSGDDFNRLVDMLAGLPAFMNPIQRFTLVYGWLQGSPRASTLLGSLNLGANASRIDAVDLVHQLIQFGQDIPGREVLTLVVRGLLQNTGEDSADFLRGLLEQYPFEAASAASSHVNILFVAANPDDQARIRTDREYHDVDAALQTSRYRERFTLTSAPAARVLELPELLLRHQPGIVHFSGHGEEEGLLAENEDGSSALIPPQAAAGLFRVLGGKIRVVVLNACLSEPQAEAIAGEIGCVVGMTREIGDRAAILFSTGFYQGLGYGQSVQKSFDLGISHIALADLHETDTPRLICKPGVDPDGVVLVR